MQGQSFRNHRIMETQVNLFPIAQTNISTMDILLSTFMCCLNCCRDEFWTIGVWCLITTNHIIPWFPTTFAALLPVATLRRYYFPEHHFILFLQSFSYLLKELAEFVTWLPKEGQDVLLDDMHAHVADSDDVVRKPVLVSWLQSLSYISLQANVRESYNNTKNAPSTGGVGLSLNRTFARLWYFVLGKNSRWISYC
jgi:hypothetical protein